MSIPQCYQLKSKKQQLIKGGAWMEYLTNTNEPGKRELKKASNANHRFHSSREMGKYKEARHWSSKKCKQICNAMLLAERKISVRKDESRRGTFSTRLRKAKFPCVYVPIEVINSYISNNGFSKREKCLLYEIVAKARRLKPIHSGDITKASSKKKPKRKRRKGPTKPSSD